MMQGQWGSIRIVRRRLAGAEKGARRLCVYANCSLGLLVGLCAAVASAAPLDEVRSSYLSGDYAAAVAEAEEAIRSGQRDEDLRLLKIRAELASGEHAEALATLETALKQFPGSIQLRLLGRTVYLVNGKPRQAEAMLTGIAEMVRRWPWRYNDAANRIVLGRYFLMRGADARQVLEVFYDRVKQDQPEFAEAYVASAQLALDKHDYQLAAESLEQAVKLIPEDPRVHYLLARAYSTGDNERAKRELTRALQLNPHHADSLLWQVDKLIDAEDYAEAEKVLERVLQVNQRLPEAWAYRAVIAHFRAEYDKEKRYREKALADWSDNPAVDHLIGRKLAQHYRFAEGAAYQRRALQFDSDYLAARMQLAQDLLRLGDEQGWQLVEQVRDQDPYDVVAHNLTTLQETLSKYRTLETDGFLVRMEAREAEIYGQRVLELLSRARERLVERYEVTLQEPTIVEIFPQQKDFAIRTFGLPGGDGFLGVCFGRLITANSPASQGASPSNWEAVLWHEYCHVVTLQKSQNKMPRWLSEGISVYEERQQNAAWGQDMLPQYREMILGDELTPVSELSGAFLNPKSPLHLQFAYYESSLVVEFLIDRYGLEMLKRVLTDLGVGMPINDSLRRYAGSLAELDQAFTDYIRQQARQYGAQADWDPLQLPPDASLEDLAEWNESHPKHFRGLQRWSVALIAAGRWQEARERLLQMRELCPRYVGQDNAYQLLAQVYRQLGETGEELAVLNQWTGLDGAAVEAYVRMMELHAAAGRWTETAQAARQMLAVNPLLPVGHRYLAQAAENLGDTAEAIGAYRAVLRMDPVDPADVHHRLARLHLAAGEPMQARRQVLMALDEAPRFRAAHRTLLQLVRGTAGPAHATAETELDEKQPGANHPPGDANGEKATGEKATGEKATGDGDSATELCGTDRSGEQGATQ